MDSISLMAQCQVCKDIWTVDGMLVDGSIIIYTGRGMKFQKEKVIHQCGGEILFYNSQVRLGGKLVVGEGTAPFQLKWELPDATFKSLRSNY